MSSNALAVVPAKKKQPKKKGTGKKEQRRTTRANIGIGNAKYKGGPAKPNRNPLDLMSRKLSGQEAGMVQYLMGLSSPTIPCRVPIVLGSFLLDTNTYSYVFNGTVSATSTGFAYVGAVPDGWQEFNNDGGPTYQFLATTTQGNPVWFNVQAGTATITAPLGSASGANHAAAQLIKVDTALNAGSRYRNTSIILSVWPDSPATTTQGDICIAAIASEQAQDDGILNSATFASVAALPQEYVSHIEMPLANWNPEHQAHAFPVPYAENCFTINYMQPNGTQSAGGFGVCAIVNGAAVGQTFRYRIEYKYETTAPLSFMTGQEYQAATEPVPTSALVPHLAALKPMSTIKAPAKHLTAIPLHAMGTAQPGLLAKIKNTGPSIGSVIGKAAATAVSAGIKQLPYVGGVLGGMFDSLFG